MLLAIIRISRKQKFCISIEATGLTLEIINEIDTSWINKLKNLIKEERLNLSAVDILRLLEQ